MPLSTEIVTARLRITPFTERHLTEEYLSWLNNPGLMRFSEQRHKPHSIETCRRYWQSFHGTPNHFWAIESSALGHIGNLNAYVDPANGVADVGVLIGKAGAQHKGYGLEAWIGTLSFLLFDCAIRKVTAGTLAVNGPMISIARKSGMREDGSRRRQYVWEGREVDVVYFALFRDESELTAQERDWPRYLGAPPGESRVRQA